MAQRGGQPGNTNAAKAKRWVEAIERHLTQNPDQLRKIAEATVQAAMDGQAWAVTEIGNRLDGKPVQQVDMSGDLNLTRTLRDLTDDELLRIATQQAAHDADTDGQTVQ
jgi:hypothetical protein